MYCPSCGKEISDASNFCMYCGHRISRTVVPLKPIASTEWEYKDFIIEWEKGKGGLYAIDGTPAQARAEMWPELQAEVKPQIQKLLDEGWQPITEIGPAAIEIQRMHRWLVSGYGLQKFKVSFRRPKRT